jgi:hypothetical protein
MIARLLLGLYLASIADTIHLVGDVVGWTARKVAK